MAAVPFSRSTSDHRKPRASPRLHPVKAMNCNTALYGVFFRAPVAHGVITELDVDEARAARRPNLRWRRES